jgi:hypothetical protein
MATNAKKETLLKQAEKIKARLAELEAKETAQKRKEDTRLKVLVGAAFLADKEKNPETEATIRAVVQRGIVNQKDRDFLKSQGWL